MLFAELRGTLKDKIASGYMMTGSDIFLINKSVELILTASKIDPLSVVRFDEGVDIRSINQALQNISMFGAGMAVIVRGNDSARLYLKPVKSDKELEKVDCNPMTEDLVVKMIMQNKKFGTESAFLLARAVDNNFASVTNEMEKLIAYTEGKPMVEKVDIEAIVMKTEKAQIFDLTNCILKRDVARVESIVETLNEQGVDDYAVFGSLLSFARRLFYVKESPKTDGELSRILSVHPYAITATRRDSRHIAKERANDIYNLALKLEYEIKSGVIATDRAVILLIGKML